MKTFIKHHITLCFIVVSLFQSFNYLAQQKNDTTKKIKLLVVPVVFKTPETGWAGGVSGSLSFNTNKKESLLTRTSVIQALGMYTQRKQNLQVIDATIYFPKEKYILTSQLSHSRFPENFWGIGPNTKNENAERYNFEQFFISAQLKRKVINHVFIGAIFDFQTVFNIHSHYKGGVFDTTFFYGKTNTQVFGAGLSANYDTRNATFWPTKGIFLQSSFVLYNKDVLSTYTFEQFTLDLRFYQKTFKNQVVAFQLYNYTTSGQTPLRNLAMFGGSNSMRGFYQGRYRDKALYSAIAEYRAFIYWRFSACVFGGVGDVYNNINNINLKTIKASFGGGIRFALLAKEKLNLRLDYGYADKYNQGFYFTVAECF